ncbi:MAG: hypothetical protein ABFS12_17610 [Bacteroidota bacterium]
MLRVIFITLFPAILFAGNIELSIKDHNGNSSYIVESPSQNLKAKLIFPFEFNALDVVYNHKFTFFDIKVNSSFVLNDKTTTGKDYDWHNDNLTVFSTSDNKIDKYTDFGLEISKDIWNNLRALAGFNYKTFDFHWSNTYQEDFINDSTSNIQGETLKYQQTFYQYNLGLNYKNEIYKDILIELEPALIYAFIESKDTHVLRSFYTLQKSQAFGYTFQCNANYKLTQNSKIKLSLNYEMLKDKNVDMDYYNLLGSKYLTYPSSYRYENRTIGIGYIFSF